MMKTSRSLSNKISLLHERLLYIYMKIPVLFKLGQAPVQFVE